MQTATYCETTTRASTRHTGQLQSCWVILQQEHKEYRSISHTIKQAWKLLQTTSPNSQNCIPRTAKTCFFLKNTDLEEHFHSTAAHLNLSPCHTNLNSKASKYYLQDPYTRPHPSWKLQKTTNTWWQDPTKPLVKRRQEPSALSQPPHLPTDHKRKKTTRNKEHVGIHFPYRKQSSPQLSKPINNQNDLPSKRYTRGKKHYTSARKHASQLFFLFFYCLCGKKNRKKQKTL